MTKRGRPPMDELDKKKWKSVNIDVETLAELRTATDKMEAELGFRPTVSQALKRILKTRQSND